MPLPLSDWSRIAREGTPLPLREILVDSVYYPACGMDGDPVKYLHKQFQSFVYVDYGVGRDAVVSELTQFKGYELEVSRELQRSDLIPNGWNPPQWTGMLRMPDRVARTIREPFAIWALYRRHPDYGDDHGPTGFSLLYIGGDGVATFHALHYSMGVTPRVICLIQPGTGFGGNWTDFQDRNGILARVVLENPAGRPDFLLYGGWGDGAFYRTSPWPEFATQVAVLHGRLRLFSRVAPDVQ
jgi:hypothetical protein